MPFLLWSFGFRYCSVVIPLLHLFVNIRRDGIVGIGRKLCSPSFLLCSLGLCVNTSNDRLGLANIIVAELIMSILDMEIRVN